MNWIADAISEKRALILSSVKEQLPDISSLPISAAELEEQTALTLDLVVEDLRLRNAFPLFARWSVIGRTCAERDIAIDEVPNLFQFLKRAIWEQMRSRVDEGVTTLDELIDAMMDVETVLDGCRYYFARGYIEEKDVANVARNQRIEALYSLAEVLSAKSDAEEAYTNMTMKVADIVGLPRCALLLLGPGGSLEPAAANYEEALETLRASGPDAIGALDEVARGSGAVVLRKGGQPDTDLLLSVYHTPTVLAVPMKSGDKVVGLLLLDAEREGDFTRHQVDIAIASAGQAAVAIEKSELVSEMEGRLKHMAAIGIVARSLTTQLDPADQLTSLLEMACALMRADSGVFMLVEEMFGELKEEARRGAAEWAGSATLRDLARDALDNERIIPWQKGVADGPYGEPPEPVTSCLTAPLMVRDKAIGILSIASSQPREKYGKDDIEMFGNFAAQAAVTLENTRLYERLQDTYLGAIGSLAAAIEARDPYTVGHSARVTQYAVAIAESMGLSSEEVEELRLAGLLHDLGKIGVPDSILNKAGRLSEEEYSAIKMHPALSMRIIEPLPHLGNIIPIIYNHHERYDGNGYMDGKAGEKIPLGARIIAVADSFEAMTSDRPYRKALSREEAVNEIARNSGSQFDPEVVQHFLTLLEETTP